MNMDNKINKSNGFLVDGIEERYPSLEGIKFAFNIYESYN
jgi:hypothetical protein